MLNKNIETVFGLDSEYADAEIVVFGAPFDSTTSYRPGARFGGRAIRAESYGLETFSPYLGRDAIDIPVFDAGELELSIGSAGMALERIEGFVSGVVKDLKLPVMLGGEHLVTLGAIRAAVKRYPDLRIIHFDAHSDCRDEYLGVGLSHACVMRRVWELVGDGRIFQYGIRSGDAEELRWSRGHLETHMFDIAAFGDLSLGDAPVYFTLDLDVLDPSVFPGTGTPEPGGVGYPQLQNAIHSLGRFNIVGCDLVELAPNLDPTGVSTAVACKLLRELLLSVNHTNTGGQR